MQRNQKKVKSNQGSSEPKPQQSGQNLKNHTRKENNNFETLLNSIVDPVVIINEKGQLLTVNASVEAISGFSKEELIGKSFFELNITLSEDKAALFEYLQKRALNDSVEPSEVTFTGKTGELRHVEVNAKKINYYGQPAEIVILHDVTQRRNTQEQLAKLVNEQTITLKESQEQIRSIFDSSPDALTVCDLNATITDCNQAKLELHGFSKDKLIGKNMLELVSPKDLQRAISNMKKALETGVLKNVEYTFLTKGGKEFPVECSISVLKNAAGNPAGYVSTTKNITERKKAEEDWRSSEEKYRELINGMNDTAWVIDLDANFIDVNDAAVKVLGYSRDELLSMGPSDIDNSLSKEQISALVRQMPSDERQVFETTHTTKNGKKIPVEISSSLVTYHGKQAVLSIARNITERKKAEDELRLSRQRLALHFEQTPLGVIEWDTDFKVTSWNPAAERIFGFSREEAIGQHANFILPESAKETVNEVWSELLAQRGGSRSTNENVTKTGQTIICAWFNTPLVDSEGKLIGVASQVEDITQRRKMADEVRRDRDMLDGVTSSIGAGLAIISKDYKILWANNFLKQFAPPHVEGKVCYSTFNTIDTVCPDCGVKKVFDGASYDAHEYATPGPQGTPYWVEIIVTPLKDNAGNVVAALELTVNITEKKQMQQKLSEYSQQLEKLVDERTEQLKQTQAKLVKSERLAAIGELAGMVGHDLRNPLTSIKGAAYYLKSKGAAENVARGKEMLETIDRAIEYSNKIVNDLLEYSREIQLYLTETTPKSLLKNALPFVKLPDKIQLKDAAQNKPVIKVDIGKINRVFVNLIKNAIDAMPNGGTLTITSKKAGDNNVEIAFKDTGMGMSKETVSKLWTPLFTTKAQGMGFGLAICKRIVEAHGGKITAESAIGKGTTFTVNLPLTPEQVPDDAVTWIFKDASQLPKMT